MHRKVVYIYNILASKLKGRDHVRDIGVVGGINLKCALNN
jgi:hypothetical protein